LQDRLDHPDVLRIGGADEMIIADIELRPGRPKQSADPVRVLLGLLAGVAGRFDDLVAVLIGSGQKERLVSNQLMIAIATMVV
jgi:hypothetical protein